MQSREEVMLGYATLTQIIEELQERRLPFVLLVDDRNGAIIAHQKGVKNASVIKYLNSMVWRFLDYVENKVEIPDEGEEEDG